MSMSLPSTLEWKLQMCVHTTFFSLSSLAWFNECFVTHVLCAGCEWVHDGGACHGHVTPTHCIMSSTAGCSTRSGDFCRLSGNGQSAGAVGAFSVLSLFMPDTVIMILWQWHTNNANIQTTISPPHLFPFVSLQPSVSVSLSLFNSWHAACMLHTCIGQNPLYSSRVQRYELYRSVRAVAVLCFIL